MSPSDMPTLCALWPIVDTPQSAINFLLSKHAFYLPSLCILCGGPISLRGKEIRCTRDGCRKRTCLFAHYFFSGSRIPIHDILLIAYIWFTGGTYTVGLMQSGLSTHTVCE